MKCFVCGCEIEDYGNNPFPLCGKDDFESRCCDICNMMVIQARLAESQVENKMPKVGNTIAIFWSSNSDVPTECIKDNGKFMAGEVYSVEETTDKKHILTGAWGKLAS